MRRSIYAYAWDLFELSTEQMIGEFRSAGLNSLTFAGACDMGPVLRLHGRSGRLAFPEDGAIYFTPEEREYGALKPHVSRLTSGRDVLRELSDNGRLSLSVFLNPLNNRRLGTARNDLCCANAFGDHYPHCLSPTHPEVREYAIALCRDVSTHYAAEHIVLEAPSWLPPEASWRGPSNQIGRNVWLNAMLSLSFTDNDLAGAAEQGIDAGNLRQRVASKVDHYLASDVELPAPMAMEWLIDDLILDHDLITYQAWLAGQVKRLIADIRASLRPGCKLAVLPRSFHGQEIVSAISVDLPGIAASADRLEIPFFSGAPDHNAAEIYDLRRRAGQSTNFGAVLQASQPSIHSQDQLEENVRTVLSLGAESLAFSHYGTLRPRELRWIAHVLGSLR